MKKVLYIECGAGISGDMTLGALVDLGVDIELIKKELAGLSISGDYQITTKKIKKNGISGTDLDVVIEEDIRDHSSFRSIGDMIEVSTLNSRVKQTALNIFTVIAEAEAAVHQKPLDEVVFHEVGAVDSIVDIVGTAIAVDLLSVDEIFCSQVHDGTGFIECRHGVIPVPVPAVLEMMKSSDIPMVINEGVGTEMVTPTGFGILEGLNAKFRTRLELNIEGVGYGYGNRDTGLFNAVRIIKGQVPDDTK